MVEPSEPPERSDIPFGFRRVAADEHMALVRGVFNSVAGRYDLMNDLMSGGLNPENVADAIIMVRPWAVDVSSGVETDGVKDPALIRAFVERAREVRF